MPLRSSFLGLIPDFLAAVDHALGGHLNRQGRFAVVDVYLCGQSVVVKDANFS